MIPESGRTDTSGAVSAASCLVASLSLSCRVACCFSFSVSSIIPAFPLRPRAGGSGRSKIHPASWAWSLRPHCGRISSCDTFFGQAVAACRFLRQDPGGGVGSGASSKPPRRAATAAWGGKVGGDVPLPAARVCFRSVVSSLAVPSRCCVPPRFSPFRSAFLALHLSATNLLLSHAETSRDVDTCSSPPKSTSLCPCNRCRVGGGGAPVPVSMAT